MHILAGTIHAIHDHCTNMPPTRARGRQIGLQLDVESEAPLTGNQPPHRQRPRGTAQAVPLLNWYREQILEKLAEIQQSPASQEVLKLVKQPLSKLQRTFASIQAAILVPTKWRTQTMRMNSNNSNNNSNKRMVKSFLCKSR